MNKKEYLEAQRELMKEREERKEIAFNKFDDLLQKIITILFTICIPLCYWIIFYRLDNTLHPHAFLWAVGAITIIWLERFCYLFESKEQKEVTNGR